ncbi:hypothetical protein H5410_018268 [Solanum commersonii]|uniref:Uncharacterized protein n=1 Tax=Solanum commersonii TaxID=4109 RepID=A0A9J6A2N1_SOLCO|nr:hypothetical protein H5410_018268 [Solanum commersonii]
MHSSKIGIQELAALGLLKRELEAEMEFYFSYMKYTINHGVHYEEPPNISRPRVLITSCRKQRRNSIALASSIQTILKYIVIQESKAKSTNIHQFA